MKSMLVLTIMAIMASACLDASEVRQATSELVPWPRAAKEIAETLCGRCNPDPACVPWVVEQLTLAPHDDVPRDDLDACLADLKVVECAVLTRPDSFSFVPLGDE